MSRRLRSALAALARWLSPATWPGAMAPVPPAPGLHVCAACHADFACPMEWEAEDAESWWIRLRCGACGHERVVIADNDDAAAFDLQLARHTAAIERSLAQLDRERMAAEVERFITALDGDLLDAGDFA